MRRGHKERQCNYLTHRDCIQKESARFMKTQADTGFPAQGSCAMWNSFVLEDERRRFQPGLKRDFKGGEGGASPLFCFLLSGSPCNATQFTRQSQVPRGSWIREQNEETRQPITPDTTLTRTCFRCLRAVPEKTREVTSAVVCEL